MHFDVKGALVLLLAVALNSVSAQELIPISDGGTVESTNCDNPIYITDSNADDGNYLPGETYQITACLNTLVGDSVQIIMIPQINGNDTLNLWDVDGNSTLFIYAGVGTGGELLGAFNSITDPDGVFLTTTVPCVTFVWESGENSSGEGFLAQINCLRELQPFTLSVFIDAPFGLSTDTFPDIGLDENVITFCFGDTLNFGANPSFPLSDATGDGYEQLAAECNFIWDMGNGDVFEGIFLNTLTYSYPEPGGYLATITLIDVEGQFERYEAYLLMAPRPIFSNIVFGDTLCLGDTTVITGGILFPDTVGVSPSTSIVQPNYDFTDSRFLPDGNGELYQTIIEIEGFTDDPVIDGLEDFLGVCVNIEHSYLGDLEAWLTCPNGQTALLFDGFNGAGLYPDGQNGFGGGNTFLGDANDSSSDPGIGFSYCFSDDAALGTMEAEFAANNTIAVNSFPPVDGNAMVEGTYTPSETFETALAGCPVNGDWTLNIADNIGSDDGWIFEWSMEFNPEFDLDTIFYTPDILEAYWLDDEDIVFNSDTSITIVPQNAGDNAYTFVVEDSFGCIHDTTFFVYVRPLPIFSNNIACFLIDSLNPNNDPDGGVYEILDLPTETAELIFSEENEFGFTTITATEFGIYNLEYTETNCGYTDQAEIDFRPVPQIQPFFEDTVLCGGSSILYDAGPQEANSGNFFINWTQDGGTYNTTDYATTVNSSGEIILTITGFCGSAADTSNVTAIEVNFEGDTICGLVPRFRAVEVVPESIGGSWTTDDDGIIFSAPDAIVTEIIAPEFGDYLITYTDVRCPNDAVTRNFKWFEQPDLTILPENPIFCFEDDSLNLTAVLQGAGNGSYFWELAPINPGALTPTTDFDFDQFQNFPPLSFEPIESYMATVFTFDEYGRCPEPGRDTLIFTPIACVYNIPNIVTPNGDGLNDLFQVQFVEFFPGASLAVFNRWGQEVFSSSSYDQYQAENKGWDPDDLPGGVYFYELKLPSVDKIETGNLTIITEEGSEQ
jgi:gliding motility-associated-like protein